MAIWLKELINYKPPKEEVAKLVNHAEALWAGGEEYVDDELM